MRMIAPVEFLRTRSDFGREAGLNFGFAFKWLAAAPARSHEERASICCRDAGRQVSRRMPAGETETVDEEARKRPRRTPAHKGAQLKKISSGKAGRG